MPKIDTFYLCSKQGKYVNLWRDNFYRIPSKFLGPKLNKATKPLYGPSHFYFLCTYSMDHRL